MKSAILLCALVACANAAYYLLDTLEDPDGSVTFWGTLRYDADPYTASQKECIQENGLLLQRGQFGAYTVTCPETDSNLRLGLNFPQGYNGTITEVYDYHKKLFYPCVKINHEVTISYACAGVLM
ncbi:MAG: hypothetical protein J3Q66DRAFT_351957 [Benniella sp.]|nr:MAG: hypothetical protein J3Q66DRAFT_351957 [Benniella sp.]